MLKLSAGHVPGMLLEAYPFAVRFAVSEVEFNCGIAFTAFLGVKIYIDPYLGRKQLGEGDVHGDGYRQSRANCYIRPRVAYVMPRRVEDYP